jgi:hypothetical protein
MRELAVFISSAVLMVILTACGGGARGTVTGMAGTWIASPSLGGVTYDFTLRINGPDDDFSGQLDVEALGYEVTAANFTGGRYGNSVGIRILGTTYQGTLSGNRLTFDEFYYTTIISRGAITFSKR